MGATEEPSIAPMDQAVRPHRVRDPCGREETRRVLVSSQHANRAYMPLRPLMREKVDASVILGSTLEAVKSRSNNNEHTVYLQTGRTVVIKVLRLLRPDFSQQAMTELLAMQLTSATPTATNRPNAPDDTLREQQRVVPLLDFIHDVSGRTLHLVMPYIEGGDLFELLSEMDGALPEEVARKYFTDVVQGMLQLKAHGIAHGDVSLENIMLQADSRHNNNQQQQPRTCSSCPNVNDHNHQHPQHHGHPQRSAQQHHHCSQDADATVATTSSMSSSSSRPPSSAMLIDLGSCSFVGSDGMVAGEGYVFRGKLSYIPPEIVTKEHHAHVCPYATDVWALGVCLYTTLTGRPLYLRPSDRAFVILCEGRTDELLTHYAKFGMALPPSAFTLISSMLQREPEARPTLEQILQHPWVRGCEN